MMKNTIGLVAVALFAFTACGGGSGDDDDIVFPPDAGIDAGGGGGDTCNAVAQTGCLDGQKCAFVLDLPESGVGHVECVPDGDAALGAACTRPANEGESDNCAKGGHCYNGTCRETCSQVNDTCDGECGNFVDGNNNQLPVQWCLASCDPLLQDCAGAGEGCVLANDGGICLLVSDTAVGQPCNFANSCVAGAACIGPAGGGECRTMCGTIDQIWGVNDEGLLTFPLCCGPNCGDATKACGAPNEVCWVVGDGGGGVLNTGFCQTDDDASNTTGTNPFVCSCSTPVNPPEICGDVAPATGEASQPTPKVRDTAARTYSVAP